MDHLTKSYGNRVVDNEEYVERVDRNPAPAQTARTSGRRQAAKTLAPHEVVYAHLAEKWGKKPSDVLPDLFDAMGGMTVPEFLANRPADTGANEAISAIDNFYQNGGSTEPTVVTVEVEAQASLEEVE